MKTLETIAVMPTHPAFRMKSRALFQLIFASLLIGLCAQIKISLPFTPVPVTGQSFAVLFVGALLGSRKGALAVSLYVLEGCLGLPVWAGGASGILHLMGPTGGYRLAYILQGYLVGLFVERQSKCGFIKTASALLLSCWISMLLGSLWLGYFVGWKNILLKGFYPFIPGETIKSFLLAFYLRFSKTILTRKE